MDEQTKQFVSDFLGIKELPTERQTQIMQELEDIINRKINLSIYDKLSPEDITALEKLSDQKEIGDFVLARIPDLYDSVRDLATAVVGDFKSG